VKVFLSGTYADQVEYRDAVSRAVEKIGHELIRWDHLAFSVGESISETINKHIDSADLVILVVSEQYGAISSENGVSFTEHEYNLALENNKPVLVFVSKNSNSAEGNQSALGAFKERLLSNQVVSLFSSPSELEEQVVTSVSQYLSVIKSLENPKYKWRTVEGVSKESGLSKDLASFIIEHLPNVVIQSRVPDKKGRKLYATRKHYQKSNNGITRLIDWFAV
jgi:hypothetical protein